MSLAEFRENWEQPPARFYERYLPKGYSEEERVKIFRAASIQADCPKSFEVPGMGDLIRKLKEQGAYLAVVSADYPETLLVEVKAWGLEGVFNEIVTDADDKLEAVQRIIKENNLKLEDTYFVGDSNHEIDVSKKVGIKSVAVTWGFTSEQKLRERGPDFVVNTVGELESIVLAN